MSKKKKATTTTAPSQYAQQYITPALVAAQGAYDQNQPALQNIGTTLQNAFTQLAPQALGPSELVTAAQGYNQDVLGGKYLDAGNPYIQGQIDTTNASISDRINALFSKSGRSAGSSAQTYSLAKALGENENALRYSNYANERNAMAQAASQAPGLDAAGYQNIPALLALAQGGASIPFLGANNLANITQGLVGNSNTTTQTSSPSQADSIKQGLGTALQLASIFSDSRVKTDIRKIGEYADGLGKYAYRYIWGGPMQEGVLAQEVAELRPWALGPEVGGYMTVKYGAL